MLVDINTLIRPRLYIMDGITAMEGNGPLGGRPRAMNVLLFSTDPVALDSIACKLIGLDPEFVPTSKPGEKSGLGTYHYEQIEVAGDDLESFIASDFDVKKKAPVRASSGKLNTFVKNQITPRPIIDRVKCIRCGTCIEMCPVGKDALQWEKGGGDQNYPLHNYTRCIRCYCCQETCPEGAITIRTPFIGRLLFRN
jgi:ferredoxin